MLLSLIWRHGHSFLTGFSPLLGPLQFSSVTQSSLTLFDPMDYSMPGFPVHHQLPELQTRYIYYIYEEYEHISRYNIR